MLDIEVIKGVEFVRRPTAMIMQDLDDGNNIYYYQGKERSCVLVLDGLLHPTDPEEVRALSNQGGPATFLVKVQQTRGVGPHFYQEMEMYIYHIDRRPQGGSVFYFNNYCLSTVAPRLISDKMVDHPRRNGLWWALYGEDLEEVVPKTTIPEGQTRFTRLLEED